MSCAHAAFIKEPSLIKYYIQLAEVCSYRGRVALILESYPSFSIYSMYVFKAAVEGKLQQHKHLYTGSAQKCMHFSHGSLDAPVKMVLDWPGFELISWQVGPL